MRALLLIHKALHDTAAPRPILEEVVMTLVLLCVSVFMRVCVYSCVVLVGERLGRVRI